LRFGILPLPRKKNAFYMREKLFFIGSGKFLLQMLECRYNRSIENCINKKIYNGVGYYE